MASDASQCFICDKTLASVGHNMTITTTTYSSTPLFELLERLLSEQLDESDQCCCDECLRKLNDYDLATVTAINIENELTDMYRNKSCTFYLEEDVTEASPHIEENEESVEVLNDMLLELIHEDDPEESEKVGEELVEYLYDADEVSDNEAATAPSIAKRKRGRRKQKLGEDSDEPEPESPSKDWNCQKCKLQFDTKIERTKHMKLHRKKNALVCDICGQSYKSKAALDIHVGMHNGISPHECQVCGKKFTQKGALVRHMPLHTGEHPYQCDKCGKQFIHYSSFHMHQLAHYDIRLKKCDICGLQLRSNSHLTRHLRVHSGEKPFECPTCGQKFAQRYNMMTHFKGHQGIHRVQTKKKCTECTATFTKQSMLDKHMSSEHNKSTVAATKSGSDLRKGVTKVKRGRVEEEIIEIKSEPIQSDF